MLKWITAGESHGRALVGILSGIPAGLSIDEEKINRELACRQTGLGRSSRQDIEKDEVVFIAGIRRGQTIGSPIAVMVKNRDFENWKNIMEGKVKSEDEIRAMPRPGHADLAGILKWNLDDSRNVIERSSGRTTAVTVALGGICRQYLEKFNIYTGGRIAAFGPDAKVVSNPLPPRRMDIGRDVPAWFGKFKEISEEMREALQRMINEARASGDTIGGMIQVVAAQVPPGLGSCALPEDRLDSRLAAAVMGVPGIKAVELGAGIYQSSLSGSIAHDGFAITVDESHEPWYGRISNLAGGIEGGMTNGEPVCINAWMKPLSTVRDNVDSVDPVTGRTCRMTHLERSDTAALEAVCCVLEAVVAMEIAKVHREKFGGDTMEEVISAVEKFESSLKRS